MWLARCLTISFVIPSFSGAFLFFSRPMELFSTWEDKIRFDQAGSLASRPTVENNKI